MSQLQKITIDDHGSFVIEGPRFQAVQLRGPVRYRQEKANELGVRCYAEAHLNSFSRADVNYSMAIAAHEFCATWGRDYTRRVAREFDIRDGGCVVTKGRGSGLVASIRWPAPGLVLEPGFLSHPEFAFRATTGEGIDALGRCLADSIVDGFGSGLIGFSIGHAYRGTGDMGAPVHPEFGEDPEFDQEAEVAEAYIVAATEYLTSYEPEPITQRNT